MLRQFGYNKDQIAALVLREMLSMRDKSLERPGVPPAPFFRPQRLAPAPVAPFRKQMFKNREPVEPNYVAGFDTVDMLNAKVGMRL